MIFVSLVEQLHKSMKKVRDDATEEDIKRRDWRERWSRYIRVHNAEFVAGTMAEGISLQ